MIALSQVNRLEDQLRRIISQLSDPRQLCVLIGKESNLRSVADFRPIHIVEIIYKLYMMCLLELLRNYIVITGTVQYGCRKGFQALELVMCIKIAVEKSREWGLGLVLVGLDVYKAFDSLSLIKVAEVLSRWKVPIRLQYALLKEILKQKYIRFCMFGRQTNKLCMQRGLRQGSPEDSFIFALIISDILEALRIE